MGKETEKNLIPMNKRTEEEQRRICKMGGKASVKSRREKKTIQKILSDFLDTPSSEVSQIQKIALKLGIDSDKSIKDIFTIVCTIRALKDGTLQDLERMAKLLGEDTNSVTTEEEQKQTELLEAIKKAVQDAD